MEKMELTSHDSQQYDRRSSICSADQRYEIQGLRKRKIIMYSCDMIVISQSHDMLGTYTQSS